MRARCAARHLAATAMPSSVTYRGKAALVVGIDLA